MHSPTTTFASLLALTLTLTTTTLVSGLGLNCRGSSLCHLAKLENKRSVTIVQTLRDAIYATTKDPHNTTYTEGQHIICLSSQQTLSLGADGSADTDGTSGGSNYKLDVSIGSGGICAFPNYLQPQGRNLSLAEIRPLADQVLEHGCKTCGSATVEWGNSPAQGYLTFDYVEHPFCDGECISGSGQAVPNT